MGKSGKPTASGQAANAHTDISQMTLEEALSSRAEVTLAGHPVHNIDVFIREVTTTVVRDIVGVIEALVDRSLVKKKSGVVMDMVVQLIEEDLDKLMSKGAESLAAKRWDQVQAELQRLEGLISHTGKTAESSLAKAVGGFDAKFQTLDPRFQELTESIEVVHKQSMQVSDCEQRFTSVAKAVKVISDHLSATKAEVSSIQAQRQTAQDAIKELDTRCFATFAQKESVPAALKEHAAVVQKSIEAACSKLKDDIGAEINRHDGDLQKIRSDVKTAQDHVEAVANEFSNAKEAIKSAENRLTMEYHRQWQDMEEALKSKATKVDIEKYLAEFEQKYASLNPKVDTNSAAPHKNEEQISQTQAELEAKFETMVKEMKSLEEKTSSDIGALHASLEASVDVVREQVAGTVKDVQRSVNAMNGLKQHSLELFATAKSEAWEVRNRIVEEMQWQGEKLKKEVLEQLREPYGGLRPMIPLSDPPGGPPRPVQRGVLPGIGSPDAKPEHRGLNSGKDESPSIYGPRAVWEQNDNIIPGYGDMSKPSGWRLRMEVGKVKLDQCSPPPLGGSS